MTINLTGHHDGRGLTELCIVEAYDDPHPVNGAHHEYHLRRALSAEEAAQRPRAPGMGKEWDAGWIRFQIGPRNEPDSTPGTLDIAVLEILIHRYQCFQAGPFACFANQEALGYFIDARNAIKARAHERAGRGVLGRNEK